MKRTAHSIALRLVSVATQKALVSAVAALVIVAACAGVWGHGVYAAKVRAEQKVQKQAATLNDVMAKLNRMEAEIQQQAQTLNTKLEAVEYQNTKLAAYEVRAHFEAARFELAAGHRPSLGMPGAYAQISPSVSIPLELESKVCGHGGLSIGGKLGLEAGLEGNAEGDVGAEAFGDGVDAKVAGKIGANAGLEAGADGGLDAETCLTVAQFNIFGTTPTIDEQQFLNTITSGGKTLADELVKVYNTLPQMTHTAEATGLDALANINQSFSPQQILANIENPSQTFSNFANLVGTIPLPSGISNLFQDPSSLFPKPGDLNASNICANTNNSPGGTGLPPGLLSNACSLILPAVADLNGVKNTISQFGNVQGDLTKFENSLSQVCSDVNIGIAANNAGIQLPPVQLPIPNGINFTPPSLSFQQVNVGLGTISIPNGINAPPPTLAFNNVSVGGGTISSPFQITPLPCTTF